MTCKIKAKNVLLSGFSLLQGFCTSSAKILQVSIKKSQAWKLLSWTHMH